MRIKISPIFENSIIYGLSLVVALSILGIFETCAGKLAPNSSPKAQAELKVLNVASAISDSIDGIIAANEQGWLNDQTTGLVLFSLKVTNDSLPSVPDPIATAQNAVTNIQKLISVQYPTESLKWAPYLNSLSQVLKGLQ